MSSFNFIKACAENDQLNVLKAMKRCFFLMLHMFHFIKACARKFFITYYQEVHQYLLYGSKHI